MKVVAVIEDDLSIREVVKIVLEENKYKPVTFEGSKEFFNAWEKGLEPNVILLDIWLNGEDGEEAAKAIKAVPKLKVIPLIVFTANNNVAAITKRVNAEGYLKKPFDIEELVGIVKKFS